MKNYTFVLVLMEWNYFVIILFSFIIKTGYYIYKFHSNIYTSSPIKLMFSSKSINMTVE